MITPYISQQPVDDFGLRFSNLLYSVNLSATTDTTLTVPGNAQRYKAVMKISYNGVVWVAINETAAVPGGDTFASTTSELINDQHLCREVKANDVLHFYTPNADTVVSVAFYALFTNN